MWFYLRLYCLLWLLRVAGLVLGFVVCLPLRSVKVCFFGFGFAYGYWFCFMWFTYRFVRLMCG